MNELIKTFNNLPEIPEEINKFIIYGEAVIKSHEIQLKALKDAGISKKYYDAKLYDTQHAAEIVIEAECKLGELLSIANEKQGKKEHGSKGGTIPTLPEGITKKKSHEAQTLNKNKELVKEIEKEAIKKKDIIKAKDIYKEIKKVEKDKKKEQESIERKVKIADIEIRKGDFKEVLNDIYDIDLIVTDPPYPKEYIECWSDLSLYTKEHLKEDGFLVAYSGQYNLPEVIKRLSEHLTYVWTFCLYHEGKKQLVNGVNIMCGWKPVLIFSKGNKKMRYSAYDVVVSEEMEKHSHKWQQSESGVMQLIEIFSKPGDLIVDPFAGSGTFLKVAKDMGCKAIGAEIK